jgi:integrase
MNDGQRVQRSTGQTDRSKAMAMCLDWERAAKEARMGNFSEAQARKIVNSISERAGLGKIDFATTRKFFMDWVESKEVTKAESTGKRYRKVVEDFLETLGRRADLSLVTIRAKDVSDFQNLQIKEGKSNSSANEVVKILRATLNHARRQGIISTNPAEAVELLASDAATRDTFTRNQIEALLDAANLEWTGMILFGACHGMRIKDASRLTWENIDQKRGVLTFVAQKTSRQRRGRPEVYPLHPDVVVYLGEVKQQRGEQCKGALFPSLCQRQTGGVGGLSIMFRERVMAEAGIHAEEEAHPRLMGKGRRFFSIGFHSFRHTAISEQANLGISREIRMKLSGHKSEVHERYTHHEIEVLRKEIEKVPSFFPSRE